MVQKIGIALLSLIAVIAVGGLILELKESTTGNYAKSGGGRWYYGPMLAQMAPDEACLYAGLTPSYPMQVATNEWGTQVSLCRDGDRLVGVPLVQTVVVR